VWLVQGIPVTNDAAAVIAAANSSPQALPSPLDEWLPSGAVYWLPRIIAPERNRPQPLDDTPALRMRRGAQAVLDKAACEKSVASRLLATLPSRWEKLGDCAVLPPEAIPDEALLSAAPLQQTRSEFWHVVCAALGVKRVAKQAVVDQGRMRQSRAIMIGITGLSGSDDEASGWVNHRENSIIYTFDVTRVMFSSGNGTEKMRVGGFNCTGEVVLDLYAGIGTCHSSTQLVIMLFQLAETVLS
jgi:hypothetical protein